jgi:hypothetical protein
LNFSAASLLRMGRFAESAARYAEYVDRFPNGERIDTAHLNVIDTLREANKPRKHFNGSHAQGSGSQAQPLRRTQCSRRCVSTLRKTNGLTPFELPISC